MSETQHESVLARHGETAWSLSGRHTGTTDLPLTARGEEMARRVGQALAGRHFSLILVSPLLRARQTCDLAGFGAQALVTPDLAEWTYGAYEGLTTAEIHTHRPGWSLWQDGCPEGEDAGAVGRRADRVIERIRATGGNVLLFAHGHVLRVLAARWLGLPAPDGKLLALETGSLGALGYERDQAVILRWNAPAEPGPGA